MPRALIIDDDLIIQKMIAAALTRSGYDVITADDGLQGISAVRTQRPDVIITDVNMPGIDGYEVTRRLRRDPDFVHTPILVLTTQLELEEKLKAFEAGADDYMSKPFEPAELTARLGVLLRRSEAARVVQSLGLTATEEAHLIAVHSLRGGAGCSSFAVNLAVGLAQLWEAPTLLMDLDFSAGQVALMLDTPLKRTWADVARFSAAELDIEVLRTVIGKYGNHVNLIAAPTSPTVAEALKEESFSAALKALRPRYEYIVADLEHDFGEVSLAVLDAADVIVMPMAPEMASIRAAAAAIETYNKLGYPKEKIQLVMNWTFERHGLARKSIEIALHTPVSFVMPFAPDKFVTAINQGRPLLSGDANDPLVALLEDFAYRLSKERHQTIPPAVPSQTWQRVNKRLAQAGSTQRR